MITNAILSLLELILGGVLSIIPSIPVPSWIDGSNSAIGTVFQDAGLMSVWFPVTLVSTVLLGVLAVWLSGFAVKVARMVISLLTGGGGSAA